MRKPPLTVAEHGECGVNVSRRFLHLAEVVTGSLTGEAGCPPRQTCDTDRFGGDASEGLCRRYGAPVVCGLEVVRTAVRTQPSRPSRTPPRVIVNTSGVVTCRLRGQVNRWLNAVRRLSDGLSGPPTRATWATCPSRGPGTLWALQSLPKSGSNSPVTLSPSSICCRSLHVAC